MTKVDITLAVHTASDDGFLKSKGIPSAAAMLVDCLNHQEFDGTYELVYVDLHYDQNKEMVAGLKANFPIRHVDIHKDHRYWLDKGHVFIAAAKNSALIAANGELFISCDDAEVFAPNFISEYWRHYKDSGKFLHAAHRRFRSLKTKAGLPVYPLEGETYINDSREKHYYGDVHPHQNGDWLWAGSSCSLEMAVAVGGHWERYDSQKSSEDVGFGLLLQRAGAKFVIDRNVAVNIIDHAAVYMDGKKRTELVAIENYGLCRCVKELKGFDRVNCPNEISNEAIEVIRHETLKHKGFDPLAPERAENWAEWLATPSFNLRQQRAEMRHSPSWANAEVASQVSPAIEVAPSSVHAVSLPFVMRATSEVIAAWKTIPLEGWDVEPKARSMVQAIISMKPQVILELGTFGGKCLVAMAMALKHLGNGTVYGVDPYSTEEVLAGFKDPANISHWSKLDLEKFRSDMIQQITNAGLTDYISLIRETSEKAASRFQDGSISLLHIDGSKGATQVMLDAKLYLPKVAPNGWVYVNDINWSEGNEPTVRPALDYLLANGCSLIEEIGVAAVLLKDGIVPTGNVATQGHAGESKKKRYAIVELCRIGDIVNVLPIAYELHRQGHTVDFYVSAGFEEVLEAVSYVNVIPLKVHGSHVAEAVAMVDHGRYDHVLVTHVAHNPTPPPAKCDNFCLESWARAGVEWVDRYHELPLIFDRRDRSAEAEVVSRLMPGTSGKPILAYNLTGSSSPCAHAAETKAWLETEFSDTFDLVDIGASDARCTKVHHLLGLIERTDVMLTVDTSTLHLSYATGTPTVAIIPTGWHGAERRKNVIEAVDFDESVSAAGKDKIRAALGSVEKSKGRVTRLFVNAYQDSNPARNAELLECERHNATDGFLDRVFRLRGAESERMTFNEFFEAINRTTGPDDINIIANSDIYFDESIRLAMDKLGSGEAWALTRWDDNADGVKLYDRGDSQDAWVFKGPIKTGLMGKADFCVGRPGCDNRIAALMHESGYRVMNPCKTIRPIHLHRSDVRNYPSGSCPKPYLKIGTSELGTEPHYSFDPGGWSKPHSVCAA